MQLDQARIAIAERSWFEILDLALHVIRRHAGPLALAALAGIAPFALINHLLSTSGLRDTDDPGPLFTRGYWLMLLVMIEAPLATAPLTLYLGQALFVDRPSPRQIFRDYLSSLPQILLLQGVLRTILILPVLTWIVPYGVWPYLNEVILLERNPLTRSNGRISTLARNASLHRASGGEFLGRAVGVLVMAPLLVFALTYTQKISLEWLLGVETTPLGWLTEFHAALWIVACYFTTARFLSYLDLRIRSEGWEVELLLRAQHDRLVRQIA